MGLEFRLQAHTLKLGMMTCICNPRAEIVTSRSLDLWSPLVYTLVESTKFIFWERPCPENKVENNQWSSKHVILASSLDMFIYTAYNTHTHRFLDGPQPASSQLIQYHYGGWPLRCSKMKCSFLTMFHFMNPLATLRIAAEERQKKSLLVSQEGSVVHIFSFTEGVPVDL